MPPVSVPPPSPAAVAAAGKAPDGQRPSHWRSSVSAAEGAELPEDCLRRTAEELGRSLCRRMDSMEESLEKSFEQTLEAVLSRILTGAAAPGGVELTPKASLGLHSVASPLEERQLALWRLAWPMPGTECATGDGLNAVEAAAEIVQQPADEVAGSKTGNSLAQLAEVTEEEDGKPDEPRHTDGSVGFEYLNSLDSKTRRGSRHSIGSIECRLNDDTVKAFSPSCTIEIHTVHRQFLAGAPTKDSMIRQKCSSKLLVESQSDQSVQSLCLIVSVIHPNSRARLFWLVLTLFALVFDVVTIPLGAFSIGEAVPAIVLLDLILLVFWTIDIAMSFRTAYYVSEKVETRPCAIATHYLKTWFFLDLCIVLMGWTSEVAFVNAQDAAVFRVARFFRLLRICRLLRIAKLKEVLESIEDRISSNVVHLAFHVAKLIVGFATAIHFTACLWYAIGEGTDGWPSYDAAEVDKDILFWYSASLRWALAQVNGRTDMDDRHNMYERLFTCFVAAGLGILLMTVFISSITAAIMELGSIAEEGKKKLRQMNAFLKKYQISSSLAALIKRHSLDTKTIQEMQDDDLMMLSCLPKAIQFDLLYEIRAPLLLAHPLFGTIKGESKRVLWHLCNDAMCPVVAEKDSTIFDVNDFCNRMLVVVTGLVLYTMPEDGEIGKELRAELAECLEGVRNGRNASSGQRISEAALWMDWHNCGRLAALELTSHFVALNAEAFGEAVKQHLGVHARSIMYGNAFVLATKGQAVLSDIMDLKVQWS